MKSLSTYTVSVYMAGDIGAAKRWIRRECWDEGLCVTVTPTTFIYTGGAEDGFVVGFVNYPRFPTTPEALRGRAIRIAVGLIAACAQRTALLVAPDLTTWLTREPPE